MGLDDQITGPLGVHRCFTNRYVYPDSEEKSLVVQHVQDGDVPVAFAFGTQKDQLLVHTLEFVVVVLVRPTHLIHFGLDLEIVVVPSDFIHFVSCGPFRLVSVHQVHARLDTVTSKLGQFVVIRRRKIVVGFVIRKVARRGHAASRLGYGYSRRRGVGRFFEKGTNGGDRSKHDDDPFS